LAFLVEFESALPLQAWMQVTVTPLEPHPGDPS
jgi:muconolactone delta-isomerase